MCIDLESLLLGVILKEWVDPKRCAKVQIDVQMEKFAKAILQMDLSPQAKISCIKGEILTNNFLQLLRLYVKSQVQRVLW